MAATIPVEVETGTYNGRVHHHPHNGYFAADFSSSRQVGAESRRDRSHGTVDDHL